MRRGGSGEAIQLTSTACLAAVSMSSKRSTSGHEGERQCRRASSSVPSRVRRQCRSLQWQWQQQRQRQRSYTALG